MACTTTVAMKVQILVGITLLGFVTPCLSGALSLQASPLAIDVCPGRNPALVRIVATGPEELSNLAQPPKWQSDSNVIVTMLSPAALGRRKKGPSGFWILKVESPQEPLRPGFVHVFTEIPSKRFSQVATTSFEVRSLTSSQAAFPGKLELQSAWDTINEQQQATFYLLISNTSPFELHVTSVRSFGNSFEIEGLPAADAKPTSVLPFGLVTIPIVVSVPSNGHISVGKHRLMFEVDVAGEIDGCQRRATLAAQRDVAFAVIGESSILTAIGIPSFLLMPGFLMIMVMVLMWRLGVRPTRLATTGEFPFPPKSAEFWTLAITLSLIVALIPKRAGFFVAYRIDDVLVVWMASFFGAGMVFALVVAGLNWWDARHRLPEFSMDDEPLDVLRKMARRRIALDVMAAIIDLEAAQIGHGQAQVMVVYRGVEKAWIAPRIVYRWSNTADRSAREKIENARRAKVPELLLGVLEPIVKDNTVVVQWDSSSQLKGPREIQLSLLREAGRSELVVEE